MRRGRWWTLLTAGLWAPHLLAYLIATVLFLVVAAPVERRIGPLRFVVAAVVTQVLGSQRKRPPRAQSARPLTRAAPEPQR